MGVAGRHERHADLFGDIDRNRRALVLQVDAVVLNLDEEVVLEDLGEPLGELLRFLVLLGQDELIELARQAARSGR